MRNELIACVRTRNEDDGMKVLETVKGKAKVVLLRGDYNSEQLKSWKDALTKEIGKDEFLLSVWSGTYPDYTINRIGMDFEKINNEVIEKRRKS